MVRTIHDIHGIRIVYLDKKGNIQIATATIPAGSTITSGAGKPKVLAKPDPKKKKDEDKDKDKDAD